MVRLLSVLCALLCFVISSTHRWHCTSHCQQCVHSIAMVRQNVWLGDCYLISEEECFLLKWNVCACVLVYPVALLPYVCCTVQFYSGIVELCLAAASKRDPQLLAVHFYRQHQPSEDTAGSIAYAAR